MFRPRHVRAGHGLLWKRPRAVVKAELRGKRRAVRPASPAGKSLRRAACLLPNVPHPAAAPARRPDLFGIPQVLACATCRNSRKIPLPRTSGPSAFLFRRYWYREAFLFMSKGRGRRHFSSPAFAFQIGKEKRTGIPACSKIENDFLFIENAFSPVLSVTFFTYHAHALPPYGKS